MPEGDTIFRAARTLDHVFAGEVVTRFESVYPALTRVDYDRPLAGRTVVKAYARGKHLLVEFSGDLVLRTHMRMSGSWHVYPAGAPWRRPARDMRLLFATRDAVAVGFDIPVAEFLTVRELARSRSLRSLGPDLLSPGFDRAEALRRLGERGAEPIAEALLDQRVVAGIGNVFKSEILFIARTSPFAPVSSLPPAALERIIDVSLDQMKANVMSSARTLNRAFGRRTTRRLDPRAGLWVYGRAGDPCRVCGAPIASRATGLDARLTYWCPRCQA